MEKLIDEFDVVTETGETVTLYEYQEYVDAGSLSKPGSMIRGMKRLEDEDGSAVNYLGDGKFELIGRGVNATGKVLD